MVVVFFERNPVAGGQRKVGEFRGWGTGLMSFLICFDFSVLMGDVHIILPWVMRSRDSCTIDVVI